MTRHRLTYNICDVLPYINWVYYYHAWQVKDKAGQARLKAEAMRFLEKCEGRYEVRALVAIGETNSDGDDIVFEGTRIPTLRQQEMPAAGAPNLSLADFVRPLSSGKPDRMGVFATTVDSAMVEDLATDDYLRIVAQLLADRLAEAAAELMHEQVRKQYWGYAPHESLTIDEMHAEKFDGIRPAVGYPSLPDASVNFLLDAILGFGDIGIRLTESGAMKPHASTSGLIMAHPAARYFAIGRIGEDQLRDYARRRGLPLQMARRFLAANIE